MKSTRILPSLLLALPLPPAVTAQTAHDLVTRAENLLRGKTSVGTYEMTVTTPEFTRTMRMKSWWVERTSSTQEKSLIVTESPKKEAGNKWLRVGTDMWNYLRATETTIRIPPSMMLQSWNGSDFTNDDLARESSMSNDYTAKTDADDTVDGEPCWKLTLTPKPDAPVVWGHLTIQIRKKDYLPTLVQYFDERGTLVRHLVYSEVRHIGGRTIPTTWTMYNDTKPGHKTVFRILDVSFDVAVPDRVFSLRELQRGN
jgi:outer membrane lipoprotein-sorting protein